MLTVIPMIGSNDTSYFLSIPVYYKVGDSKCQRKEKLIQNDYHVLNV